MKPVDALNDDYNMYFNKTFMLYDGVVNEITVEYDHDNDRVDYVLHGRVSSRARYRLLDINQLECWWPRAGAFNVGREAVYIGRQAYRNMKKSATVGHHYKLLWGNPDHASKVLWLLAKNPDYVKYEDARKIIGNGDCNSVAISRDLIMYRSGRDTFMTYRGEPAGQIERGKFKPLFKDMPAVKRTIMKLKREGVPCI